MFTVFIIFTFLSQMQCAVSRIKTPSIDGRIVGGVETTIEDHPYQVSLRYYNSFFCGGSILNENVVLTAGHCINPNLRPTVYSIQYGVSRLNSYSNIIKAKRTLRHEKYNDATVDYDIALVFLSDKIKFSRVAKPIALVTRTPAAGSDVIVIGWGALAESGGLSNDLQQVELKIFAHDECKKKFIGFNPITERMICAGIDGNGKDSCQGDSGGPLTINGKQAGIVSWGYGCAREGYPGVYTSVANLNSWIVKNAKL